MYVRVNDDEFARLAADKLSCKPNHREGTRLFDIVETCQGHLYEVDISSLDDKIFEFSDMESLLTSISANELLDIAEWLGVDEGSEDLVEAIIDNRDEDEIFDAIEQACDLYQFGSGRILVIDER